MFDVFHCFIIVLLLFYLLLDIFWNLLLFI